MDLKNFLKIKQVYTAEQEQLIKQEFCRLGEERYLDHAGATLYSEQQVQNVFADFAKNIYANPHSNSISGKSTDDAVDIVRYQILEHFNTNQEEYSVIFTSSATAALKTIAECFDYGIEGKGVFVFLESNHTSVLGMRSFAKNITEVKVKEAFSLLSDSENLHEFYSSPEDDFSNNIFVYPAQCNFSGTKFPLAWINTVKNGKLNTLINTKNNNWSVALDCATYVSTSSLDLSKYKPDFVTMSFYKIFGYPTGLGALLVRRSSEGVLQKKYFGGGTVQVALSSRNVMIPRQNLIERFEDGTVPFLSILSVKHGFDTLKRLNLNFELISQRTFSLAQFVYRNFIALHHSNGQPVAVLYHDTTFESRHIQGGIMNFNLLRPNGEYVGYSEVQHIANLHGIHLRTGCFCNPGACQRYLKLEPEDVFRHFKAGHICGDQHDLVDGYPTGSVRISFGYMSTLEDAEKFLEMIERCFAAPPVLKKLPGNWEEIENGCITQFLEKPCSLKNNNTNYEHQTVRQRSTLTPQTESKMATGEGNQVGTLEQILLYPVKSCGTFSAKTSWPLTSKGLLYDRQWMITNSLGLCLTQKHNKKLCLIKPFINLKTNSMKLEFKDQPSIVVSLDPCSKEQRTYLCQSKVCRDQVQGWDCGDDISDWLSKCLDTPGLRLLRQFDEKSEDNSRELSFANKAQYLLINRASVKWLMNKIPDETFSEDIESVFQRFRPNFVLDLNYPFQEDEAEEIYIDRIPFKCMGKCTRCQMICINQTTGLATKEPLVTLSKEFKGKISFGMYLKQNGCEDQFSIKIGSLVMMK